MTFVFEMHSEYFQDELYIHIYNNSIGNYITYRLCNILDAKSYTKFLVLKNNKGLGPRLCWY